MDTGTVDPRQQAVGTQPTCWIVAGPNGAGKTTFALEYLPRMAGCQNFINADLIAAGLSPSVERLQPSG